MKSEYIKKSKILKALSDPTRLSIVDMLSCGEMCACKILEKFSITQPTLSHHMKILCSTGLVNARREGRWMHYSLNSENIEELHKFMLRITRDKEDCICK
ncbi:MAG: winged helix-turn-helix transcriptional regulator [Clostridiales bacterium]|nr:winged helix-turn-helix transcriptional regulator [Clostridiales bacterium]